MRPFFNNLLVIKDFFSTPDRQVTDGEFIKFWQSLGEEEKVFYRFVPLI
jgi:hypothetical protein